MMTMMTVVEKAKEEATERLKNEKENPQNTTRTQKSKRRIAGGDLPATSINFLYNPRKVTSAALLR